MTNIRKTIGFTTIVSLGIGLVFFLIAVLIPQHIVGLFTTDAGVIANGCAYIRTLAPAFLLLGITQPFYIALRSTQQTKLPLFISLAVLFLISKPILSLYDFSPEGAEAASKILVIYSVYLVILFATSEDVSKDFFLIHRYRSGKWAKNVIEDID